MNLEQIARIEQIAFNAWPAAYCDYLGGWILRATNGVTRRANSVFPYGDPLTEDMEGAIRAAVSFYKKRGLLPRFQMTKASQPEGLDKLLSELNFTIELVTAVQTAPIEQLTAVTPKIPVLIHPQPNPEWLAVYAKGSGFDSSSVKERKEIINRITSRKACASAMIHGEVAGIGLGVVEREWLGLFSIVTLEEYRRRGAAKAVNHALALWGKHQGAQKIYLQVVTQNKPANALYQGLGFEQQYCYWYRRQNAPPLRTG